MRKYLDKEKKFQFKGSIFVQFKTLDGAKAFMARESVKYGDTELIRKWRCVLEFGFCDLYFSLD